MGEGRCIPGGVCEGRRSGRGVASARFVAGATLVLSALLLMALAYPPGFRFIEVPDPLAEQNTTYPLVARSLPAIGAPFFDERFGAIKTRVTDQNNGRNGRHEYARFDPFNADQSMILLLRDGGGWCVYRTASMPYNTTAGLVIEFDLFEPRWDPTSSTLLWALEELRLVALNVLTDERRVIKDWTADPTIGPLIAANPVWRVTTREEGESSIDKRYWAFLLQGDDRVEYKSLYLFTWDRRQNRVLGVRPLAGDERDIIDWVGMSPLGNSVLIGGDPTDTGTIRGFTMANRELTQFHLLGYAIGHQDVALDANGREVVVGQNARTDYIDLIPIDTATSAVGDASQYPGSGTVPLIRLFYNSDSPNRFQCGVHVSCNHEGWAVVSTHIAPGLPERNWLDRTITLIRLDPARPRVYYLAKVHNTAQEEPERAYWEETHATITTDGRKVVWASNWGLNVGQERMFLMQLDMPPGWDATRSAARRWRALR